MDINERRSNQRNQFNSMFPSKESRNSLRYDDYSPYLLSRPTPIYQPSNIWNFTNPPLRFRYLPQNNVLFESPQTPHVVRQMREKRRSERPEKTESERMSDDVDDRDFEKLPKTDEQFTFVRDIEFPKWEKMIGIHQKTVRNVESFEEIFSPTMFLRDKSSENCADIIQDIPSLTHLDKEVLKSRLNVANETLKLMKKENETGINSLRNVINYQLSKYDKVVISKIREVHELTKKTEEGLREKRDRMNFRIKNERAPLARILINCRDVLEIILPFLHVYFLISNVTPVCSYFLNFVEKRVKLDFIFREEGLFVLYRIDRILSKYRVRGLKYFNYVEELRDSSFHIFLRTIKMNSQSIERISIFPPFLVSKNYKFSGNERWGRPLAKKREAKTGFDNRNLNSDVVDIQFKTDLESMSKMSADEDEVRMKDMKMLQEAVSMCHRLQFLEMVDPPPFTNFSNLKGISLSIFRTVDLTRLQGLRFNYLFFPGVSVDELIEKRKEEVKQSTIGELERLVRFFDESEDNVRNMEFLNLTKKRLSESAIERYAQVKSIVHFSRPYFTSIFSHVERFSNLSELILPFFDGMELYTDSLIHNLPRFIVTLTKFQTDRDGRGWRHTGRRSRNYTNKNRNNFFGSRTGGGGGSYFDLNTISRTPPTPEIINRFVKIENVRQNESSSSGGGGSKSPEVSDEKQQQDGPLFATPEEFSRSYYFNMFSKKVELIRKLLSLRDDPLSHQHHTSPIWKDTFSVCYDEILKHEVEEIRQWLTVPNICLFMGAEVETLEEYEDDRLNYLAPIGNNNNTQKVYIFDMLDFSKLQGLERVKKFRLHFRESAASSNLFQSIGFQRFFSSRLKYLSFVISDDCCQDDDQNNNNLLITRCILRNARLFGHWLEKLVILIVDPEYKICEQVWEELISLISSSSTTGDQNHCKKLKELEIRPPLTMKGKYFCFKYYHKVRLKLMVGEDRVEEMYRVLKDENERITSLVLWRFKIIQERVDYILRQKFLLSNK